MSNSKIKHEESNDGVIKEVPVYLCRSLPGKVNVAKFPYQVRPGGDVDKSIFSAKMKPEGNVIELNCALNTSSEFYDSNRGVDGMEEDKSGSRAHSKFQVQGTSCASADDLKRYMFMIMAKEKVFLVPIADVYLFFPTFQYSCKTDEKQSKKTANKSEKVVDKNDAKSDVKEAITAVTMQFSQDKPPSSKSRTDFEAETMNDYYEKLRLEPWVDLKYFSSHSPYSMKILEILLTTKYRVEFPFLLKPKQFVKVLFPPYNEKALPYGMFRPLTSEDTKQKQEKVLQQNQTSQISNK